MTPRVLVAMSGGVDSSVAAALVAEAGYEAVGVTMKLLPGEPTGFGCCGSPRDIHDAKRVCEKIGIRHYLVDAGPAFEADVIRPFVEDYLNQRTPNPCVECNRSVKFKALFRLADLWDAGFVATGHYARIAGRDPARLLTAVDEKKDQTYFLHTLTQKELGRLMFPVGDLRKDEVRAKARELGLATAEKPESQDICFIPGRDYRGFLKARECGRESGALRPGEIKDSSGAVIGRHQGLSAYTIGQRRGLDIRSGGPQGSKPMYVTGMDAATNSLLVGDAAQALRKKFRAGRVSWIGGELPRRGRQVSVRVRYRGELTEAALEPRDDGLVDVGLSRARCAIAPGQAAVFYDGNEVLGGATIEEVLT